MLLKFRYGPGTVTRSLRREATVDQGVHQGRFGIPPDAVSADCGLANGDGFQFEELLGKARKARDASKRALLQHENEHGC